MLLSLRLRCSSEEATNTFVERIFVLDGGVVLVVDSNLCLQLTIMPGRLVCPLSVCYFSASRGRSLWDKKSFQ